MSEEDARPARADAPRIELIRAPDGTECWKLTCVCGKRLISPVAAGRAYGRCPKCGRRLRLPLSHTAQGKAQRSPAQRTSFLGPISELVSARTADSQMLTPAHGVAPVEAEPRQGGPLGNKGAAATAADRLRPRRPVSEASAGHISAWPLASLPARAVATLVDATVALLPASLLALLASLHVLAPVYLRLDVLLIICLSAHVLNDGWLHIRRDGSLGKKLVGAVVRDAAGMRLPPSRTLARAALKCALCPGWVLAFFDPSQRTAHDRLVGSRVMRGRARTGLSKPKG